MESLNHFTRLKSDDGPYGIDGPEGSHRYSVNATEDEIVINHEFLTDDGEWNVIESVTMPIDCDRELLIAVQNVRNTTALMQP